MKWEKEPIGRHCEITSSKRIFYSEYTETGIPFFRSKEIIEKNQGQEISEPLYISEERYNSIKENFGVPSSGDLLLTSVGTIGVPYIVKDSDCFYFKDGNLTWFRNFDHKLLSSYLRYWITSVEGQGTLYNTTIGSSQKALTISALNKVHIPLPPYTVQERIVEVLSCYDTLIENNQKQIKLLEEASQRLYQEWFVKLRFPGHEKVKVVDGVPEGWKRVALENIIEYEIGGGWGNDSEDEKFTHPAYVIRGTDIYGVTHGDFLSVPFRFHTEKNLSARQLEDGDIVFEVSGGSKTEGVAKTALIRSALLGTLDYPVMCASFCKLVRFHNKGMAQYMYDTFQYLRSSGVTAEFDKKSASSIVNYRWKDFLIQQDVLVPPDNVLHHYNSVSERLFNHIMNQSIGIEKLKEARDRLLPKLMSGEIEV